MQHRQTATSPTPSRNTGSAPWRPPGMYGQEPSAPAVHATEVFHANSTKNVLELGAGYGRDALSLPVKARRSRRPARRHGLEQLKGAAQCQGLATRVTTAVQHARALHFPTLPWTPSTPTCCCAWPCPPRRSSLIPTSSTSSV